MGRKYYEFRNTFLGLDAVRLFCGNAHEITAILITPLFEDFATDNAAPRVRVLRTRPLIANDRTLFNKRVEVASSIDKLALYDAGEVVLYVANDVYFELHRPEL